MKLCDIDQLINRNEAIRYLGYGTHEPTEDILQVLEECEFELKKVMQPDYLYLTTDIQRTKEGIQTQIGKILLTGTSISKHLSGCERAVLSCATLGSKVDLAIEKFQKEDMLKALLLDAASNAAVEELRKWIQKQVADEYPKEEVIWQFGIGYGDLPLSIQPKLLDLLQAEKKIGLSVNAHYLLTPLKSISGVMGLRKKEKKLPV